MDKPEQKINVKLVQHSFSATDSNGQKLTAVLEAIRALQQHEFSTQLKVELVRPESPERDRLRLKRTFSREDVGILLNAADKILALLQAREHMQEKTPRNGIEFSIDVLDSVKVGASEAQGKEPSYFVELSNKDDSIRFQFGAVNDWDAFKEVFQYAR